VGDAFYIVVAGTVSVTQSSLTGSTTELVRLSAGASFGELALISKEPRKASVSAVDEVICLKMDVSNFNSLLGNIEQIRNEDAAIAILQKVSMLSSLSQKQRTIIARNLTKRAYSSGSKVFKQGDSGEEFFMIASGEVSVEVNHVEVARLKAGDYFGETALLSQERRNATITAQGGVAVNAFGTEEISDETVCLCLSRENVCCTSRYFLHSFFF
jgi:cAMP-dependent protein kinase regulator